MKKRLAIIGSGDLGQQIAYFASGNGYKIIGFYDDYQEKGKIINNTYSCLGKIDSISEGYRRNLFDEIVIAIGYKHLDFKQSLFERFEGKMTFATIIHPTALVDLSAKIGRGTVIYPGCVIDQQVVMGDNILMNIGGCIAHDTRIGSHSFLSPRVAIAGFVSIGNRNIIGINTTIIDNITTVDDVQFGGGSVVIKNTEHPGLYVGNPIRFIR